MSDRVLRRILNAEVIGLVLVYLALQVLLFGVQIFVRGTSPGQLFWLCLASVLLSWLAGSRQWNGRQASAAFVVLGLVVVRILGARIAQSLLDLMRSLLAAGPQIIPTLQYRLDVDTNAIVAAWSVIRISSEALFMRWQTWLTSLGSDVHVNDALVRTMIWTYLLWLLSAWIGWYAAKRNAMASLLPGAALLTHITYTTGHRSETLWALVVILLLLMGVWNYKRLTSHWESHRIDYSDSIRYDNSQAVLIVIVIAGLLAFITPSVSWRDVRDYLRELERERERQNQVVVKPSSNASAVPQPMRPEVHAELPREHMLSAGAALSEDIVMTVKTGELPPIVIQSITTNAPRYYWRSVVYDQYAGGGWLTSSAPSQDLAANEPMIGGVLSGYKLIHLDVQMQQPEGRLYWSGMLSSADIPLTVEWRLRPQSNLFADQTALLQADMFAVRTEATAYKADAFVPIPTVEQLRDASTEYPVMIRDRYISLPSTLPERVRDLARQITEAQPTSYDKAKAIENYLRTHYPYDLEIGTPPEDQDVADYFLFDLKRGYCDYYATAMVVLARASGLPARFVSGYASGEYDAPNAQYVIRELHAHSWPEIYFPEIGWVEFEPTGNQPEIEREEAATTPTTEDGSEDRTREFLYWITSVQVTPFLIMMGAVLFIVILYFTVIEPMLFLRVAPALAIDILYKRLYRSGRLLAGERTRAETVLEFRNKLVNRIQDVQQQSGWHASQRVQEDVEQLTSIYQSTLFSDRVSDSRDVRSALKAWRRLRWSLFVEKIKYWIVTRTKQRMPRVNS